MNNANTGRDSVRLRILDALHRGEHLTPLDAWHKYGTSRLAAHVFELRKAGHGILTKTVAVECGDGRTAHVASYSLEVKAARGAA